MTSTDGFTPWKAKIEPLEATILANAEAAEEQRHLPREVATAMAEAGLYRLAVPARLGGAEAHPLVQIQAIEAISQIHGSTGWNLMIGIEVMGLLAAQFPQEAVREMFDDQALIISGALNPQGRATREEGGYRISGQWPFASGIHNASYFWCQSMVEEDGEKATDDQGLVLIEAVIPVAEGEILDTWQVSGLRGSGSHDFRVKDVFIPDQYISQVTRSRPCAEGTLFRLPLYSRLAFNKVGVATGVARKAQESFVALATAKKPRGSSKPLSARVDAQRAIAESERLLGSARAYAFDEVNSLWDTVEAGETPSLKQRARMQLACSGCANEAVKAVEVLCSAAGASANFTANPLERCMRDVMVVRQHIMVSPQYTEAIGRVLLGEPSGIFIF